MPASNELRVGSEIRMMPAQASVVVDQPAGAADTARGDTRERLVRKYGFSRRAIGVAACRAIAGA